MPLYSYKVRNRLGAALTGELEASNKDEALRRLIDEDYLIVSVEENKTARGMKGELFSLQDRFQKKVEFKDLALFCRQLSTMINAGVPLFDGLDILKDNLEKPAFRKALDQVARDLQTGQSFHGALAKNPKVFPEVLVNMVEAGELGGVLDEIMERMADHFEKEDEVRGKIKTATTYPTVILVVALGAVVFILGYVMPTFSGMLSGFGVEMPAMTKFVLAISNGVQQYWWAGLIGLVLMAIGAGRALRLPKVRYRLDKFLLKVPAVGVMLTKVAVSRFSRTLATLLRSGVPIMQALDVVKKTAGNLVIAEAIGKAQASISKGRGMAEPLRETGVFPNMVVQMVAIGEETGAIDSLLEKIADYYQKEFDRAVAQLSTVIEPVMMVLLGGVIGFLVVSMLLPMFSLIESVGNK